MLSQIIIKVNMGAAVTIELSKPADASDVASTNSLEFATNEIVRLRSDLGYLAQRYGMQVMPNNADDLITGEDEKKDFERIIAEIVHIRACLRLNTQSSKRRTRVVQEDVATVLARREECKTESKYDSESSSGSSDDES